MLIKRKNPDPPSRKLIDAFTRDWDNNDQYQAQEAALGRLYREKFRANTAIDEVLIKVTVLDKWYSTKLPFVFPMANRILKLQPDQRIAEGDPKIVNEIASVDGRCNYSFATKFCHHHEPDKFPIFDAFVEAMLDHFDKESNHRTFSLSELRDYCRFVPIVEKFKTRFHLNDCSYRELDRYLWYEGRRCFERPAAAKKKRTKMLS